MEAMDEDIVDNPELPDNMLLGENECPAYISNESKLVDLFFNAVIGIEEEKLKQLLAAAWREDPLTTLKIIFNLGNVRSDGGGKSDRINFHCALNWLWQLDPEIVLANLEQVHEHTSLKVLLDSFMYIVHMNSKSRFNHGTVLSHKNKHRQKSKVRHEIRKAKWESFAKSIGVDKMQDLRVKVDWKAGPTKTVYSKGNRIEIPAFYTKWKSEEIKQKYAEFNKEWEKSCAEENQVTKKLRLKDIADHVKSQRQNANIERLYQKVIDIFVNGLKVEYKIMKEIEAGKQRSMSGLFGKWAPTRHGKHDKATGIAKMLVLRLIPELGFRAPADSSVEAFSRIYQKEVLAKIRKVAEVPEHFVGKGEWSLVNYNRMASLCRLLWGKKVFKKHDTERYDQYLIDSALQALENKTTKNQGVKTGVLLPHEVLLRAEHIFLRFHFAIMEDSASVITEEPQTLADITGSPQTPAENTATPQALADITPSPQTPADILALPQASADIMALPQAMADITVSPQAPSDIMASPPTPADIMAGPQTTADIMEVVEVNLQWWGLVQACRAAMREGDCKLGNCLPVCDVSGSMHGEPMEVAIALSMLLAESTPTDSPFHKVICTFSETPTLKHLSDVPDYDTPVDKDLLEACRKEDNIKADSPILGLLGDVGKRAHEVQGFEWGESTNLDATFDLLLNVAVENKVSNEFMEKTCIIIFSDMEFDDAIQDSDPETMHERIRRKFSAAGFKTIPKVVYWNLRASNSQPVGTANYKDVALLSGFSPNLMKSFLKGDLEDFNPMNQVMQTLSHPMYDKLVVPQGCRELPPDAEGGPVSEAVSSLQSEDHSILQSENNSSRNRSSPSAELAQLFNELDERLHVT